MRVRVALFVISLLGGACGSSSGPSQPNPISRSLTFVAFLDENANGALDDSESIRIPGAEVSLGGASGRTEALTGSVTLAGTGGQTLSVDPGSLPPFYRAPGPSSLIPPLTGPVYVPIGLPLGPGATPGVFLAFGDSITNGNREIGDGRGYIGQLERMLSGHFGRAAVINDGLDSSSSERGDGRILESLANGRPGFTLILYGTNDWGDPRCSDVPCFTISSLRSMVRKVKAQGGHPFVGTILMTNVGFDYRASPQRNEWVRAQNELIREMAAEEEAVLVDLHLAFERSPQPYSELFADATHPSAPGYEVLARTWFDAITKPR